MGISIVFVVHDGVQILDVTGPAAVFAEANAVAGKPFYTVRIASANGGILQTTSAVQLATQSLKSIRMQSVDVLLICGGDENRLLTLADNASARRWITQASARCKRFGSVCTGVFLLAELGLINDSRVATHWESCGELQSRFPGIEVDENALYVEDGKLWTSAGVTTGIDMCLAMVERDLGVDVANRVAKTLVLYARRPGYQSQFSAMLSAQQKAGAPFAQLVNWMESNLTEVLDVPQLAARAAMSERNFYRRFTESVGQTPARFVETLRLDQVRHLLSTRSTLKEIAARTGFATTSQMSKAFERRYGVTPQLFRETQA